MYGLKVITPAAFNPITLAEAKTWCRVDHSADDDLITALVAAASRMCARAAGRTFGVTTWEVVAPWFPSYTFRLPAPPLASVTWVKYRDTAGTVTTLDSSVYGVNTDSDPGTVYLLTGQAWPTTGDYHDAVRIRFTAGYATIGDVPETLKTAVRFCVGNWYEEREAGSELPAAVAMLLGVEDSGASEYGEVEE